MKSSDVTQLHVAQTRVWHGEDSFLVSTANRTSSAPEASDFWYAETLVWELDPKTNERGKLVWQGSSPKGTVDDHCALVKVILAEGAAGINDTIGAGSRLT